MDKELEEMLVKSIFNKRIQQRILFELFSLKKWNDIMNRLCHNYSDILRKEFMIEIQKPNYSSEWILNFLKNHGAGNDCYVMSWNQWIDGKYIALALQL